MLLLTNNPTGLFAPNHIHYPFLARACFRAELVFGGIGPGSTADELWWVHRKMQITKLVVHYTLLSRLHEECRLGSGDDDENDLKLVLDSRKTVVLANDLKLGTVERYPHVGRLMNSANL